MKLSIQTNLNGCLVYIYNNNLRLVPVIIASTDYSGGSDVLVRRFIIKAADWDTVTNFYIGNSIQVGSDLVPVTEENADTVVAEYLGYTASNSYGSENEKYVGIDWSLPRQVDFGEAFTVVEGIADIHKFIFNETVKDSSGKVIRVADAEQTKQRIRDLVGEDAWLEKFKLTITEYKTIETATIAKILSTMESAQEMYTLLMKYYRNTTGYATSDTAYRTLNNDKNRIKTCIEHLTHDF